MKCRSRSTRPAIVAILSFGLVWMGSGLSASERIGPETGDMVLDIHAHTFNLQYLSAQGISCSFCLLPAWLARLVGKVLEELVVGSPALQSNAFSQVKAFVEDQRDDMRSGLTLKDDQRWAAAWMRMLEDRFLEVQERTSLGSSAHRLEAKHSALVDAVVEVLLAERNGSEEQAIMSSFLTALSPTFSTPRQHSPVRLRELRHDLSKDFSPVALALGLWKKGLAVTAPASQYLGFFIVLLQSDETVVTLLRSENPQVQVFSSLLMDMHHSYNDRPASSLEDQIAKLRGAKNLVWFMAYDPFRGDGALSRVKMAVKNGAAGIKFYPPSGYRPAGNLIPRFKDHRKWLCKKRFSTARAGFKRQYKSRYQQFLQHGGPIPGSIFLDKQLEDLYAYANGTGVPILSHHTSSGFQSAPGYGKVMAAPCLWGQVLAKYPQLPLIIGHAGGGKSWFGNSAAWNRTAEGPIRIRKPDGSIETREIYNFDRQAFQLCATFPNVYCDFGYSKEVLDATRQEDFRVRLIELGEAAPKSPGPVPSDRDFCTTTSFMPRLDIRKKVMFGTDWMMPDAVFVGQEYFEAFTKVFSDDDLRADAPGFFGENARRLLCEQDSPPQELRCRRDASKKSSNGMNDHSAPFAESALAPRIVLPGLALKSWNQLVESDF